MKNQGNSRFERGILKVVAFIGLIRFIIALMVNDPQVDGYLDLTLDIATATVFLAGLLLVHFKADNKWIIGLFFIPLIILLLISLYLNGGLISAGEINAFAIVIILSLTIQGRLPWIFVAALLGGVILVLYVVEQENLNSLEEAVHNTSTFALLFVTLTNILLTLHAKNVFDASRNDLTLANKNLLERKDQIESKRKQLSEQTQKLTLLKMDLEEKVLERTKKLQRQNNSIEMYLQLTLTELMKPYQKTISEIKSLDNPENDEMIKMAKESGKNLEIEVEKLKNRLENSNA